MLTKVQIHQIIKEVKGKRLNSFSIEDELIDFVACQVEKRTMDGEPFDAALKEVLRETGSGQIKKIQKVTTNKGQPNSIIMFQNYFKIARRVLVKYKSNSLVNITGLVLSLSSILVIGLYVRNELSYDKFHPDIDRVYRVNSENFSATSRLLRDAVFEEVSGLEYVTFKMNLHGEPAMVVNDEYFYDYRFAFVQEDFLNVFEFKITQGKTTDFFEAPFNAIISTSWATRIFKDESPIGKTIAINQGGTISNFTIVSVFEDIPGNSHFNGSEDGIDILSSKQTHERLYGQGQWGWREGSTYVKLEPGVLESEVALEINNLLERRNVNYRHYLQPVKDIHLNSKGYQIQSEGDISHVYTFAMVGLLILIIACINYVNLATARVTFRMKEIGVRKVLGGRRSQFLLQFIVEAFLISTVSLIVSILVVTLSLDYLNSILDLNLIFSFAESGSLILGLLLILAIISLVSGAYPGFYLSRFTSGSLLKSEILVRHRKISMRKILVVVQFGISAAIIVCTVLIVNQLEFISSKNLGFDKESLLYVSIPNHGEEDNNKGRVLRDEFNRLAEVKSVSISGNSLGINMASGNGIKVEGNDDWELGRVLPVDFNYGETMGIEMKEGRWFDADLNTDAENGFVVNEAFVKYYSIADPIGTKVTRNSQQGQIIGVTKDFHFKSMRNDIEPLVIYIPPEGYNSDGANTNIAIRLNPGDLGEIRKKLSTTWGTVFPNRPFVWNFLDDQLEVLYRNERAFATIFRTFAMVAIAVSCLGLLGLVSFSVERKFREIGIRKVLGASISSILLLVSKGFWKLILIGFVVSIPASYAFMNQWLDNFKFRIEIGYQPFVFTCIIIILIAWATVSFVSLKAARSNPVDALKQE